MRVPTSSRRVTPALAFAAAVLFAAGGGACSPGGDEGSPIVGDGTSEALPLTDTNPRPRADLDRGGTLTLPLDQFPATWNRFQPEGANTDAVAAQNATDPVLFDYDPEGLVRPRTEFLAALPQNETRDGRQVVTYRLNPEATWNDGTPIDWTAFEATWRVHREPGYQVAARVGYEDIESVEPGPGPREVVVTFAPGRAFHPVTDLFGVLAHPQAAASPAVFNDEFRGERFHPQWRAGPFTLERIDPTGGTLSLVPNPRWWGEPPLLARVVFRRIDPAASMPAFANRELDAVLVGSRDRLAQVTGDPQVDVRVGRRLQVVALVLNTRAESLADPAVRKAIQQAVDREEWARVRYPGLGWHAPRPGSAVFFPFQPPAQDNVPVTHSTEAARQTLEEAGYAVGADGNYARDGAPVAVRYTEFGDDPLGRALAQTLAGQLRAAGIRLDVDYRPDSARDQTLQSRDYAMITFAWSAAGPSPAAGMCQLMCSDSPFNLSGAGTAALDVRLRRVGTIADPARRAAEINAIEKEWLAHYGLLPLANGPEMLATRPSLANWGPTAFAGIYPNWSDVGWLPAGAGG